MNTQETTSLNYHAYWMESLLSEDFIVSCWCYGEWLHDHKPVLLFMCKNIAEWSNWYQKKKKVEGAGEEPDVDAWLLCLYLHVRPKQFK